MGERGTGEDALVRYPDYPQWRDAQVARITALSRERQARYLRAVTLLWGAVVAADIQDRCRPGYVPVNREGDAHGEVEEGSQAQAAWQEANARLLEQRRERAHPLNWGSRMLARDPAAILEQEQARTCRGCLYEYRLSVAGGIELACVLGRYHGASCRDYCPRSAHA